MSDGPRILAFAGSLRRDSVNKKLVRVAADVARQAGADTTFVDLSDYPLPVFDQDVEAEGTPESATKLKKLMIESDGFLIASPEYNSSVTAALKNAIDWASRPSEGEPMLAAFMGKTAAIMAASPGGTGGMRGLVHVRSILGNIGVIVLPDQVAVPGAFGVFDEDGAMTDDRQREKVESLAKELVSVTAKLKS
jgi:NAD(P)H-dependent FMN reductase